MKTLRYIYALLIALLFGYVISSCDDIDDIVEDDATEVSYSGKMVKTSFSVGLSASDVSGDVDVETRAGMDNANTDYPQPENGGRFKNIVIVLVNDQDRVYGVHCKEFDNTSGVKDYNYVFSDIEIPDTDINKKQYKVYAFGNVCKEHYANIVKNDENRNFLTNHVNLSNLDAYKYCINNVTIELNNPGDIYNSSKDVKDLSLYNITFEPDTKYLMKVNNADTTVTSVGMPENNTATATVMKGNTQFNVRLHRVCARIKITFRNLTGQYTNQQGDKIDNNVYIDQFKTDNSAMFFAYNTKYLYDANADVNYTAQAPFDLLQALNCKVNGKTESDHVHNKIENDSVLTVSMYVFEIQNSNGWKYDLKVDRGKSLGNQSTLEKGNVYVMWDDHSDTDKSYKNSCGYCLGSDGSNIELVQMDVADKIPFGESGFGNRVFWRYTNNSTFESCNVDLQTDLCTYSGMYIPSTNTGSNRDYNLALSNSGRAFTPDNKSFDRNVTYRTRLKINNSNCLQISNDKLKNRYFFLGIGGDEGYYPWVFFAKYIIKNGRYLSEKKNGTETKLTKIERNHTYELEYNVMPNYTEEEDLKVRCVRTQNEVSWSEVQK